jgi:hypothetical protein
VSAAALRLLALAACATALLPCGAARAYLAADGSGDAAAAVGTLAAPTLEATAEGGAVRLEWGAVTAPGAGTVTYAVSRDGGAAGGDCPSAAAPAALAGCTDTGVGDGHHLYAVTAYFHTWLATGPAVEVLVSGSATKLVLAAASGTTRAGAVDGLTVTAEDASGNAIPSYAGTHAITFSGAAAGPAGDAPTVTDSSGAAVPFGSPTALEFSEGVATVSGAGNGAMALYAAETASISADDGSISTAAGLPVAVEPARPERLAFADLTVTAGSVAPPCLFTCTIDGLGNSGTVLAGIAVTDAFGNVVTDLGRNHKVEVWATGGRLRRGALTIATSGPAESTRQFTFTMTGGFGGDPTDTLTAETSRGDVYGEATATVNR